ncbi:unnamed protein product [Amoebophrya sp. A120]|nr:unnamed protein product [Amoebophrya sp. A120]|eukprot:GSA120T00022504001.1
MPVTVSGEVGGSLQSELQEIFEHLASSLPDDFHTTTAQQALAAAKGDEDEAGSVEEHRRRLVEKEIFLQLGKKLVVNSGYSCYDLVGPLFQVELHQEFQREVAITTSNIEQNAPVEEENTEEGEETAGAAENADVDAAAGEQEVAVAGTEQTSTQICMRTKMQSIFQEPKYAAMMRNDDLRPFYCSGAKQSKRQQRQREEYAGVGLKRLTGNMASIKKEFYRLFSHFAIESKAIHPELFMFQDESELDAKTIQPINQVLTQTMLRFRGDVTRVNDPASGVLVYEDEFALYSALDILVTKTPALRKADCYLVRIDDPNSKIVTSSRHRGHGGSVDGGSSTFGGTTTTNSLSLAHNPMHQTSTENLAQQRSPGGREEESSMLFDASKQETMGTSKTLAGGNSYGTLAKMQKQKGLIRNPVHKTAPGLGLTQEPQPTRSQLDSTYQNMDPAELDSPGDEGFEVAGLGGDSPTNLNRLYEPAAHFSFPASGTNTASGASSASASNSAAGGQGGKQDIVQPVSVYLCLSAHVCKITLYTEQAYLLYQKQEQKKKFEDLMILAGTMNDEVLVSQALEVIHNVWPHDKSSASGSSLSPTVVHQIAANGNASLLSKMFKQYPQFMSAMLVTPDNGGALPLMVAVYQQQLKTAVLLLRALVELVKHHAKEKMDYAQMLREDPEATVTPAQLPPVLETLVAFYLKAQQIANPLAGVSASKRASPKAARNSANQSGTSTSLNTSSMNSVQEDGSILDPCAVLPEFWYCSDFVLDKLAQGTYPLVPLEEDEQIHATRLSQLQELWTLFGALGFGTANNDRVTRAVQLELLQLATFLALIKARDSSKRTVLMLACRMKNPVHEGMVKFILEKVPDCELNALDQWNKSAVDYVMESSSTSSAKLLLDYGAKDAMGQDVLLRATLDNNAHVIQFLLSYVQTTGAAGDSDAAGWSAGNALWLLRRGAQATGTFCTCFIPANCQELRVRYPLVFGRTFPRIKSLVRDSNAGKVLEDYRNLNERLEQEQKEREGKNIGLIPVPKNPKGESLGALTGLDGLDIFVGRVQCWICKKTHTGSESWVGPVALQLKFEAKNDEKGDDLLAQADAARTGTRPASRGNSPQKGNKPGTAESNSPSPRRSKSPGAADDGSDAAPTLRLFMHHACCVGLENYLNEEAARREAQIPKRSQGGIPKARARQLLKDAKSFEHEFREVPATATRTWKTSRGFENVGLKPPSYAGASDNLGSLKKGEYTIR